MSSQEVSQPSRAPGTFIKKLSSVRARLLAAARRAVHVVSAAVATRPYSWGGAIICVLLIAALFLLVRRHYAIEDRTVYLGASATNGTIRGPTIAIDRDKDPTFRAWGRGISPELYSSEDDQDTPYGSMSTPSRRRISCAAWGTSS